MTTSSRAGSNSAVSPVANRFQRSISPSSRLYSSQAASSFTKPFVRSPSSFSAQSSTLLPRSASPTRANLTGPLQNHSISLSLFRSASTARSQSLASGRDPVIRSSISSSGHRKTCMCSPTTHPGSFRCSLHKALRQYPSAGASSPSNRLNARRSAMSSSVVRIGTVEGDLVKRALAALIRPSSHRQRRRSDFQPRRSRLCKMSVADDQ